MEYLNIILGILTLVAGGGWFVNWNAARRKSNGEAIQAEAEGWKVQQDVYQKTIEDLERYNDMYRKYNTTLIEENTEIRNKCNELMKVQYDQQREIARLGRRIDGITPFLCGRVGCSMRVLVDLKKEELNQEQQQEQEQQTDA